MNETVLLKNVPQLKMSRLKEWGYLKPETWINADVTWNCNLGWRPSKSISLKIDMTEDPHIILSYLHNGKPIKYRVDLVSILSNLGKGLIWYFVCPETKKRCSILHQVGVYFYHRTAFDNVCYWSETFPNNNKQKYRDIQKLNNIEKAYNLIYSKHFRSHYKGLPTAKYLKAMKWIEEGKDLCEYEVYYG